MKDKTLLKIAFCCSLLGIIVILFLTENMEIKASNIEDITKENLDEIVKISGKVTRVTDTPNIIILNIQDETGEIKVTAFKEKNITIQEGQEVVIEGKIIEYQNELEIQAEEIRRKLI